MSENPFTLFIHLVGGQTVTLPCMTYEIVPPGIERDDDGNPVETSLAIHYTPPDDWEQTIGFLDFRAVMAVEVTRSAEMVEKAAAEQDDG